MQIKSKILFLVVIFLMITLKHSLAQQNRLSSYHFSDYADTKSSAMGFTAVSNPFSPMSYKSNPANLSFDSDINLYGGGVEDEFVFSSSTSINGYGIALDYAYTNYIAYATPIFDITSDFYSNDYHNIFYSISLSKEILKDFAIGTSLTLLDFNNDVSYKINLGTLYKIENPFNSSIVKNELYFGFAINNIGPDIETEFDDIYLPIYASIGSTFRLISGDKSLFAYAFEASLKYKNYLNPSSNDNRYFLAYRNEKTERDYWGIGFELTLFKLISIRDGYYKSPFRNNIAHTGGIGIHFPPKVTKFSISLEYMRYWNDRPYFWRRGIYLGSINFAYRLD